MENSIDCDNNEDNLFLNLSVDKNSAIHNRDLFEYRLNSDFDFNEPAAIKNININNIIGLPTKTTTTNIKEIKDEIEQNKDGKTSTINYQIDKKKKKNKAGQICLLGRKKRAFSGTGEHNKFCDDNLRKKCKHLVLENTFNFINDKIKEIFKGNIGYGQYVKKLFLIKQKMKSESSVQFNKDFLLKTLGEIFSEEISSRYTNHPSSHNFFLIKALTSDKNENNKNYQKL